MSRIAGKPYRSPEQQHGPCYILDPDAWMAGERVVIGVIAAKNPLVADLPQRERRPSPSETRRVLAWPRGRAWDWFWTIVDVAPQEPAWAGRARELRRAGWSIRRIMDELNIKSRSQLAKVLYG